MSIARMGGQWGRQLALPPGPAAPAPAPGNGPKGVARTNTAPPTPVAPTNENFEALTKYIPTETITLFVATVGAAQAIAGVQAGARLDDHLGWIIYGTYALLTPVIVWLVAYSSYVTASRALPAGTQASPFATPTFRMVAALVAFLVWALALPGLLPGAVWQVVASLGALIVSTFLSLLRPIFEP